MSTALTLTTGRRPDGATVLAAAGEIDMSNAGDFSAALAGAAGDGMFVVDLTAVEYIDSAGLAAIFPYVERVRLIARPLLAPRHRIVSITQSTELGTVYAPEAMRALADWAHAHGMLLHVDGSRLCNAAAALEVPLRALTADVGVDAVSFGATKNGAMGVEAVVLLRDDIDDGLRFRRKQAMQLASKMRYMSAQLDALLEGDLWHRNAEHANTMARRLADAVGDLAGVRITQAVEANAVFAILDPAVTERLQQDWPFYVWDESTGEVRWMTGWDTVPEDVDAFAADVGAAVR